MITINGHSLFYIYHAGRADGPALVLIHGAGGRHSDWPTQIRHMANTAVYSLDLPGHAQSTGSGHDTIDGYADVVQAFIESLGLERVVLVGHSMGGAIAQILALRGLTQLSGLVLVGTSARLRVGDAILHNILPNFDKAVGLINKYTWSRSARPVQVGLAKRLMAETKPEILHGDFFACNAFDVREELGKIALPTLVVSGSADMMTPAKHGQALAKGIPNAEFVQIAGAGHFLIQEKPHQVAEAIQQFLASVFS
ncbi:MAG: alpha/beta hydrolase [Chloroflexota bacterium]